MTIDTPNSPSMMSEEYVYYIIGVFKFTEPIAYEQLTKFFDSVKPKVSHVDDDYFMK